MTKIKKGGLFFCAFLLFALFVSVVTAAEEPVRFYIHDRAGILSASEEETLEEMAAEQSARCGISIVVLTEDGIGGADPLYYAADFYDYGGYEPDGIILFLEMEERDWRLVTTGIVEEVILDYDLDYIGEHAVSYFSEGEYADGFAEYIDIAAALYDMYVNGDKNDAENVPGGAYGLSGYDPSQANGSGKMGGMYYVVLAGISVAVAFAVCGGLKGQLNTAVKKRTAGNYLDENGAEIVVERDRFLYSHVTKTPKPEENHQSHSSGGGMHTFTSSSGTHHSGGGGKF